MLSKYHIVERMYPIIGIIITGFLPFLSDHGPMKRATSIQGRDPKIELYMLISLVIVSTASFSASWLLISEHTALEKPKSLKSIK